MHARVLRKQLFDLCISLVDVVASAGQGDPTKRASAFAKQRADIRRYESRKCEGIFHALIMRNLTNVVAVINDLGSHRLKIAHRLHVDGTRTRRFGCELDVLTGVLLRVLPALDAPTRWQVSMH